MLAFFDSEISQAVRFTREHVRERIKVDKVEDILREVPMSRSVMEYRFKKLLGHTPHDEIVRLKFQLVNRALRTHGTTSSWTCCLLLSEVLARTTDRISMSTLFQATIRFNRMNPKSVRTNQEQYTVELRSSS